MLVPLGTRQRKTMWSSARKAKETPAPAVMGVFGGLPRGLDAHLDAMSTVQQKNALLRVNQVADSCFRQCCTDFSFTKYLGSGEEQCLRNCVDKYLMLSASCGGSFADALDTPNR